jgi:hypothetical protein
VAHVLAFEDAVQLPLVTGDGCDWRQMPGASFRAVCTFRAAIASMSSEKVTRCSASVRRIANREPTAAPMPNIEHTKQN